MSATAERIKELRTQKKLTQSELAEIIKSSRGTIAKYERDERVPSFAVLSLIANALNTTVDYLQGETEDAGAHSMEIDVSKVDDYTKMFWLVNSELSKMRQGESTSILSRHMLISLLEQIQSLAQEDLDYLLNLDKDE